MANLIFCSGHPKYALKVAQWPHVKVANQLVWHCSADTVRLSETAAAAPWSDTWLDLAGRSADGSAISSVGKPHPPGSACTVEIRLFGFKHISRQVDRSQARPYIEF